MLNLMIYVKKYKEKFSYSKLKLSLFSKEVLGLLLELKGKLPLVLERVKL